jgi:hypothetical protein
MGDAAVVGRCDLAVEDKGAALVGDAVEDGAEVPAAVVAVPRHEAQAADAV